MYARFFGLGQQPFSIAPDPRYLFMSERHREALAHLLYGLRGGGGFVLLTGEVGAGKTTVCRCFMEQIPKRCNVAYIFNPKLTVHELLKSVCDEFRIPYHHQGPGIATVKDYIDPLNEFLLRTHAVGQNNVLIIDEAQNLSPDVLEQLRLLTNLETNERKLLQIILIGQPELRTMLARPELEQLAQRVIARYHLQPLSEDETAQYIGHRMGVAGMTRALPFDRKSIQRIHHLSRGVPRRINLLCDRALLGAYANGQTSVDTGIVEKAASEVFDNAEPAAADAVRYKRVAVLALGLFAVAGLLGLVTLAAGGGMRRSVSTPPTESKSAVNSTVAAAGAAPTTAAASGSALAASTPATSSSSAPVGAAAAASPAIVSAADLKKSFKSLLRSEKEAWQELAPAWNLALGEGDPCQIAPRQQVHCFRSSNNNLPLIRQLGRPGILTLHDRNNKPAYALLTGLTNQSATLRVGGVSQTVSLFALAEMWRGDFATFWRAPPGYGSKTADADSGQVSEWVATRLAALERDAKSPTKSTTEKGPADSGLKFRILAFQLAQGLNPDGFAGPITLMQLNRATGVDEPRLRTE